MAGQEALLDGNDQNKNGQPRTASAAQPNRSPQLGQATTRTDYTDDIMNMNDLAKKK